MRENYLDWAKRNFVLNQLSLDAHHLVKADVMNWMMTCKEEYDLIFCDPPTFSNTKKQSRVFDVQSAHYELICACMQHLHPQGILYFSTNYRNFILDKQLMFEYSLREITGKTIDIDFKRNVKIHRVWQITHKERHESEV